MSSSTVVNVSMNVLVSLLTVIEFIFTSIAGIAGAATVRGLWLMILHRGGKASVDSRSRSWRLLIRDLVSFIMSVWFVVSVAMLEYKLETTYVVTGETRLSSRCLRMDQPIDPSLMQCLTPPLNLIYQPWVLRVSKELRCTKGIATVGLGGVTDDSGETQLISAPVCASESTRLGDMKVVVRGVKLCSGSFTVLHKGYDYFELFPYWNPQLRAQKDTSHTARSANDTAKVVSAHDSRSSQCTSLNITGPALNMNTGWRSAVADGKQISNVIYSELCRLHGNKPVVTIPLADEVSCSRNASELEQYDSGHIFDPSCIRDSAERLGIDGVSHSALLHNMSVQFHYNNGTMSFACVDATVHVDYVFVSGGFVRRSGVDMHDLHTAAIVPLGAAVISGHCERTLNVLGRAALLFSADAEWRASIMSRTDRVTRYHGNMMEVSTSLFPLDQITRDISGSNKRGSGGFVEWTGPHLPQVRNARLDCHVRVVKNATEVKTDESFIALAAATAVCAVLIISCTGLRLSAWTNGYSWTVGSAKWALDEIERLGANDLQIVVKQDKGNETDRRFGACLKTRSEECCYTKQTSSNHHHSECGSQLLTLSSLFGSQTAIHSTSEGGLLGPMQGSTSRANYELMFAAPD